MGIRQMEKGINFSGNLKNFVTAIDHHPVIYTVISKIRFEDLENDSLKNLILPVTAEMKKKFHNKQPIFTYKIYTT